VDMHKNIGPAIIRQDEAKNYDTHLSLLKTQN
jgi:hypothetical protein